MLLVVAILASGVASYSWNIGASRLGVAVAALWTNLVPFFAVLWSMVYGFVPNAYQIVGGLVALSGVSICNGASWVLLDHDRWTEDKELPLDRRAWRC